MAGRQQQQQIRKAIGGNNFKKNHHRTTSPTSYCRRYCSLVVSIACCIVLCQIIVLPLAAVSRGKNDGVDGTADGSSAIMEHLLSDAFRSNNDDGAAASGNSLLRRTRTITTATAGQQQPRRREKKRREEANKDRATPDGTFNGGPIYLKQAVAKTLRSRVHCVGESYYDDEPKNDKDHAWKERSCRFEFICFNVTKRDFVVFENEQDQNLHEQYLAQRPFMHISDSMHRLNGTNAVSLGGINQKWGHTGIPRLKWFPFVWKIRNTDVRNIQYYELPISTIVIPFHSLNGANPGHLVWDDYLPMYTLLDMFDLLDDNDSYDLLPLRYVLQDGIRGLWASCEVREEKTKVCNHMMEKFWPLIAGLDSPYHYSNTHTFDFVENKKGESNLVCAKTALAGFGDLTDHGIHKAHGWETSDYKTVHNHGRGGQLYQFRNYMLRNLDMDTGPVDLDKPLRIVFSQKSSDIFIRNMDFERQIEIVQKAFPDASVEKYVFKEHTALEQVEIARNTAVYVSLCGGGAVTAMFLPKGSSVILYFAEDGGTYNGKMNYKPAWLDWDLFNSMSHLRVHWMPRNTMKTDLDEEALVQLIGHELALIKDRAFFD